VYLTYYKSKKKSKILAALGLAQVGDIKRISKEESEEKFDGLFAIELNSRLYDFFLLYTPWLLTFSLLFFTLLSTDMSFVLIVIKMPKRG